MKQKIVIITSKYLHPFVEKAFEDFKEDCTVTIADYTNFDHITDIYRKYEKTADGFMIPTILLISAPTLLVQSSSIVPFSFSFFNLLCSVVHTFLS